MKAWTFLLVFLVAPSAFADRYLSDEYRSPQNFAFELRGGPYYPEVDSEFDGDATPFLDVFEDHSRLRVGAELDWQVLQTPIGSLGVGIAASLLRYVGKSRFEDTGEISAEETSLTVIPLSALFVIRLDGALRAWQVPLVPYAKIGLSDYLWFAEDGSGSSRVRTAGGKSIRGAGSSLGYELSFGLALLLDFFEPDAAKKFDAAAGVNHSYLFGELMRTRVDGFSSSSALVLSETTWNAGLLLEF